MGANLECLRKLPQAEENRLEISVPVQKPPESSYPLTFDSTQSNTSDFRLILPAKPSKKSPSSLSCPVDARTLAVIRPEAVPRSSSQIISFFSQKFGEFDNSKPMDNIEVKQRAKMQLLNGVSYQGEWDMKGKRHGRGVEYLPDGGVYIGYFQKNKRAWKGRLIQGNGTFYQGHFSEGKPHGFGFYIHEDGSEYTGTFLYGLQHGRGKEKYLDKSFYEGEFFHGKKHGFGNFQWTDGKVYKGHFAHGQMEGDGEFLWPNGNLYKGNWLQGKMHGLGTFLWADGRKYVGQYSYNHKHGQGHMVWPNGKEFRGQWKKGKQHGTGEITSTNSSGQKFLKKVAVENGKIKRVE